MLKFRVWDRQLGYFCVESNIFVSADGKVIAGCETLDSKIIRYYPLTIENYVVQQFTGLLDKNNKEIYQGDIVKDLDGDIGAIQFDNGSFVVRSTIVIPFWSVLEINGVVQPRTLNPKTFEIIGNIFENQELLLELERRDTA